MPGFHAKGAWRRWAAGPLLAGLVLGGALGGEGKEWEGKVRFEERTSGSGIGFVLRNAASSEKHQIETMAGGVAVLDFDGDGRPDIFFTNGARQPDLEKSGPEYCNGLYRNLGGFRFEEVTARAGLCGEGYSMGAAAGDFDSDGLADLFVAGVNRNFLYRNRGDGRYEDVTARAGIRSGEWAVGGGWLDYDADDRLDLLVVNYVRWNPKTEPYCGEAAYRTYCHPKFYEGLPNRLYRNLGSGQFRDVSEESGIGAVAGKGMAAAFGDADGDGRLDIFVTNDTTPNFLFRNEGNGRFRQIGMEAGIAYNDDGRALSSMGADFRDIDNDGREDLFVTALANETFPLYRNMGRGPFLDITYPSRIGRATMALSGWSCGMLDFNNDGWKDIFSANGDVNDNSELFSSRRSRQSNIVLINRGDGAFDSQAVGSPALHRGAAFADFDGDGRMDAVVTRLNQTPLVLRNVSAPDNHWIGFRVPLGTLVKLGTQWNRATTAVGYASSSDSVVHFGLGRETKVPPVKIIWPNGASKRLTDLIPDRYVTVAWP